MENQNTAPQAPKTSIKLTPEMLALLPEFPALTDLTFAVLQTGLRETSWKYKDLPKVQNVENQLVMLNQFALALQKAINPSPLAPTPVAEPANAPAEEAKPTLEEAINEPEPVADVAPEAKNEAPAEEPAEVETAPPAPAKAPATPKPAAPATATPKKKTT